jgi:DNA-binding response OmpR family regulator
MRVLILDDDPLTSFTLARLFAIRGIQAVSVSSAEAAERAFERERFDAVLVDAQADQAKGLRVLARARQLDAGISLFVLSDREPDGGAGDSDIYYIDKPWDGFFLLDIVRARCDGERVVRAGVQDDRPTVQMRPVRNHRRSLRESAGS